MGVDVKSILEIAHEIRHCVQTSDYEISESARNIFQHFLSDHHIKADDLRRPFQAACISDSQLDKQTKLKIGIQYLKNLQLIDAEIDEASRKILDIFFFAVQLLMPNIGLRIDQTFQKKIGIDFTFSTEEEIFNYIKTAEERYTRDELFKLAFELESNNSAKITEVATNSDSKKRKEGGINKIFCGPPGTGKTTKIHQIAKELNVNNEDMFMVTFHPEYMNSEFIGCMKPISEKDGSSVVQFKFVPGPFAKAYTNAVKNPEKISMLIIDEINRGHAPTIFGELITLLDRKISGEGEYNILPDESLGLYLHKSLQNYPEFSNRICLPSNLWIVATMNAEDQSVASLDVAFKRRWDFEYMGINFDELDSKLNFEIDIGGEEFITWRALGKWLLNSLSSDLPEDRLFGQYFLRKQDLVPIEDRSDLKRRREHRKQVFSKLLHYLYSDILRIDDLKGKIFKIDEFDSILKLYKAYVDGGENILNLDVNKASRDDGQAA